VIPARLIAESTISSVADSGSWCRDRRPGSRSEPRTAASSARAGRGRPSTSRSRAAAAQPSTALRALRPAGSSAAVIPVLPGSTTSTRTRPADRLLTVSAISRATSSAWGSVSTARVDGATIPAFSRAISAGVSPSTPTCSAKMGVSAAMVGVKRLISSEIPPMPASRTVTSAATSRACSIPASVNRPVGARYPPVAPRPAAPWPVPPWPVPARPVPARSVPPWPVPPRPAPGAPAPSAARNRSASSSSPAGEIAWPSTRMRSSARRYPGLVTVTTRHPAAARKADAQMAVVPLPLEPTTLSTGRACSRRPSVAARLRARGKLRRSPGRRACHSERKKLSGVITPRKLNPVEQAKPAKRICRVTCCPGEHGSMAAPSRLRT
jgi:hypothetical protein